MNFLGPLRAIRAVLPSSEDSWVFLSRLHNAYVLRPTLKSTENESNRNSSRISNGGFLLVRAKGRGHIVLISSGVVYANCPVII